MSARFPNRNVRSTRLLRQVVGVLRVQEDSLGVRRTAPQTQGKKVTSLNTSLRGVAALDEDGSGLVVAVLVLRGVVILGTGPSQRTR